MRVVVVVEGEVTTRAAHSLAAHPEIEAVALLAPSRSEHFPTTDNPDDFDVVVGSGNAVTVAEGAGLPAVVTGRLGDQRGVSGASVMGLALALSVGVDNVEMVALAVPGEANGGTMVTFPAPIDSRPARQERYDGHPVLIAPGEGTVAAVMVLATKRHRVIVDDHSFMQAIALAAGVGVLIEGPVTDPTTAWTQAGPYLRTAVTMGLVIAERAA